ncbi:MAG: polysaccharide deacetylase family protein [Desulfarculus sp.]|nr:polysaccharide deacetylase family protein [Desulfarculus sp.]
MKSAAPAPSASCLVVMYHYVRHSAATPFPGIKALDPADFAAQLDWLVANFRVLDYPAFLAALHDGGLEGPTALLTFDDGFADHYRQAWPLMRQRGLKGVFFLSGATLGPRPRLLNVHKTHFLLAHLGDAAFGEAVIAYLERRGVTWPEARTPEGLYRYDQEQSGRIKRLLNYQLDLALTGQLLDGLFAKHLGDQQEFARGLYLSAEQIGEMAADGQTFGGHTQSHVVLSRLDAQAQWAELAPGVAMVRQLTGQASVPFSYPFGHPSTYNQDSLRLLDQGGYALAFNTQRSLLRWGQHPPLELPRLDTKDIPPFKALPQAAQAVGGGHA